MKKKLTILCSIFWALQSHAQDPHFSQFFSSPLTLNPANTGNFNGTIRASGNYRDQWPSFANAFTTSTISVDGAILKKRIPKNDLLSVGLLVLSDQSGNGILKQNFVAGSLSYSKQLDAEGKHSLTVGFQGSYAMTRFDPTKANFEDELTASGFTLSSSELFLGNGLGKSYLDMHAGLLYKGSTTDQNLFYLGGSVYHLGKPKFGFINTNYSIQPRINIHAGGYVPIDYFITLHGSMQYQKQASYREFIIGSTISYYHNSNTRNYYEFYAGLWFRNGDALIPYVGIEWNNFRTGFSYDVNYSAKKSGSRLYQSNELSLVYIFKNENTILGIKCPKF